MTKMIRTISFASIALAMIFGASGCSNSSKRGQWSQWVDFTPEPMRFQQNKTGWQFQWDGSYLRGTLPTPQDFANAGVH